MDDGSYQNKTASVRLLEINKNRPENSPQKRMQSPNKKMVKIISEVTFNLSQYVDQGDIDLSLPFKSLIFSPNAIVDLTLNIRQVSDESLVQDGAQIRQATYRGGESNVPSPLLKQDYTNSPGQERGGEQGPEESEAVK